MELRLPACSPFNQERVEGLRKMERQKEESVCERKTHKKTGREGAGGPESY